MGAGAIRHAARLLLDVAKVPCELSTEGGGGVGSSASIRSGAERTPARFRMFFPQVGLTLLASRHTTSARAPLAQLDRASVYETEGYWFESSEVYFSKALPANTLRQFLGVDLGPPFGYSPH